MKLLLFLTAVIHARQNAVFLILCRNSEKDAIDETLKNLEERFNSKYNYPYVFLNDKDFGDDFKKKLSQRTKGRASFGKVDSDWAMPQSIDREKAAKNWEEIAKKGVPYAKMESYRNMCRFYSRTFYKHPLLREYEYYWRVEPGVKFHCDIDYDPFDFMNNNGKKYGFVITLYEYMDSLTTLMDTTLDFIHKNPAVLSPRKKRPEFIFNNGSFNGCHFWSNFEIGSFEFFRSAEYNAYVDALEESGGFYYERWGDAPVHSIAASLFLDKSEIHFFEDIGYTHDGIMHCPASGRNCNCSTSSSVDYTAMSCLSKYISDRDGNRDVLVRRFF